MARYGVLGTGSVGQTLASKLVELGHEVQLGSREAGDEKVRFEDAAAFGEVVVNATAGVASLAALEQAGAENFAGKVLIDVSNPLDFSQGMPPTLAFVNDTSLGEEIQTALPEARVVKALNTVNASIMVSPGDLAEPTDIFVAGNDEAAKAQVVDLLADFGWERERIRDLGEISAARGMEMYLPLWVRLMGPMGGPQFNVRIVGA